MFASLTTAIASYGGMPTVPFADTSVSVRFSVITTEPPHNGGLVLGHYAVSDARLFSCTGEHRPRLTTWELRPSIAFQECCQSGGFSGIVVCGLYRYVRNPMYLSVTTIVLGEALKARSVALAAYWAVWFLAAHLFVIGYEEPNLRQRFGSSYDEYTTTRPRWRDAATAERSL
jgi:hypothetical protein